MVDCDNKDGPCACGAWHDEKIVDIEAEQAYNSPESESFNLVEMGIPAGDGVLVAFIPANGDMLGESLYAEGKREFTAFDHANVVLDLFPLADDRDVKWWMVKLAAARLGMDIIQPVWHGPAEEFKMTNIPRTSQRPGTVMAVRQYVRGPWLTLEKAKEETND